MQRETTAPSALFLFFSLSLKVNELKSVAFCVTATYLQLCFPCWKTEIYSLTPDFFTEHGHWRLLSRTAATINVKLRQRCGPCGSSPGLEEDDEDNRAVDEAVWVI